MAGTDESFQISDRPSTEKLCDMSAFTDPAFLLAII